MTLEQRIDSLEKELEALRRRERRSRQIGPIAALAIAGTLLLAAFTPAVQGVVRAEKFEVVKDGKVLASLGGEGTLLHVFNDDEDCVLELGWDEDGGLISLFNSEGTNTLQLGSDEDGGVVALMDSEENNVAMFWTDSDGGLLTMYNREGSIVSELTCDGDGGMFNFFDSEENKAGMLDVLSENGGRFQLFSSEGEVTYKAPK